MAEFDAFGLPERLKERKGLRRQVKDGDMTAADAIHWLTFKEWIRPSIMRWLRRKAQT